MDQIKLELKEEELDMIKKQISRGNAKIHRDIYKKYVTYTLPVEAEDLIVEKETDGKNETIRIPLSEESYDFNKRKNILNKIDIYRTEFQDNEHIETDLKKEELKIRETDY